MSDQTLNPNASALESERFVSFKEFRLRTGISNSTFFHLKAAGKLPPAVRLGRRGFFLASDVRAFFEKLKAEAAANSPTTK